MRRLLLCAVAVLLAAAAPFSMPESWTKPQQPFRIVDSIYYVGTHGIGVYLIDTGEGLILLDGGMEENVPVIENNIQKLGFELSDVELLINSHAHFDHAAGLAALKQDTGAELAASTGDREALDTGVPPSEISYGVYRFPPVKVDRELKDGEPIRLGSVELTPHVTAGHTPGCTTWTMRAMERGEVLDVVFPCSMTVAGNRLIGNKGYPGIVGDFRKTFTQMRSLKADVVLPAHPELADVIGRAQVRDKGDAEAFVAPELLASLVDRFEEEFEKELEAAR